MFPSLPLLTSPKNVMVLICVVIYIKDFGLKSDIGTLTFME